VMNQSKLYSTWSFAFTILIPGVPSQCIGFRGRV
jgi:hypothetical protein